MNRDIHARVTGTRLYPLIKVPDKPLRQVGKMLMIFNPIQNGEE
jgi:hypothetical protein